MSRRPMRMLLADGAALGFSRRGGGALRVVLVDDPAGPVAELVRVDTKGRRRAPAFRLSCAELLAVGDVALAAAANAIRGAARVKARLVEVPPVPRDRA